MIPVPTSQSPRPPRQSLLLRPNVKLKQHVSRVIRAIATPSSSPAPSSHQRTSTPALTRVHSNTTRSVALPPLNPPVTIPLNPPTKLAIPVTNQTVPNPSHGRKPSLGRKPPLGREPSLVRKPSLGRRPSIGRAPSHGRASSLVLSRKSFPSSKTSQTNIPLMLHDSDDDSVSSDAASFGNPPTEVRVHLNIYLLAHYATATSEFNELSPASQCASNELRTRLGGGGMCVAHVYCAPSVSARQSVYDLCTQQRDQGHAAWRYRVDWSLVDPATTRLQLMRARDTRPHGLPTEFQYLKRAENVGGRGSGGGGNTRSSSKKSHVADGIYDCVLCADQVNKGVETMGQASLRYRAFLHHLYAQHAISARIECDQIPTAASTMTSQHIHHSDHSHHSSNYSPHVSSFTSRVSASSKLRKHRRRPSRVTNEGATTGTGSTEAGTRAHGTVATCSGTNTNTNTDADTDTDTDTDADADADHASCCSVGRRGTIAPSATDPAYIYSRNVLICASARVCTSLMFELRGGGVFNELPTPPPTPTVSMLTSAHASRDVTNGDCAWRDGELRVYHGEDKLRELD